MTGVPDFTFELDHFALHFNSEVVSVDTGLLKCLSNFLCLQLIPLLYSTLTRQTLPDSVQKPVGTGQARTGRQDTQHE